ncbi:Protein of unknown function [Alkalibacterium subtropicum]|uniref:Inner membrane protein YgaP-like transmembrane domain-containing protein n=1 Tax=Alkalibacterium subtropicum TaxID=753702 RepID=A0A1I1I4X7_9LACT|nr:DUF2892 domain-containing protein [Alkalibacterium subtropicum]SFC28250.1 Protein of unknown function [Alkalibacterium subtropicum]
MKKNVGHTDRIIRITIGILLFPLLFLHSTPYKWFGLASIPLILTGLTQRCGAYALLGTSTCEKD